MVLKRHLGPRQWSEIHASRSTTCEEEGVAVLDGDEAPVVVEDEKLFRLDIF